MSYNCDMRYNMNLKEFLEKLNNYYDFEVGYDKSALINNLIKDGQYYDSVMEFYNTHSYYDVGMLLSERDYNFNDEQMLCYIVIKNSKKRRAFIKRIIKRDGVKSKWSEIYINPFIMVGSYDGENVNSLYYYSGHEKLNAKLIQKILLKK